MIAEARLENQVTWLGAVYGEQKLHLLRNTDVFVLPSYQEGFSIAILEALASQIPVVATTGCHFPELQRLGAGFVVAPDAYEVATALQTLRSMSVSGRRQMGRRGRELFLSRYTWESVTSQLEELYLSLTAPA